MLNDLNVMNMVFLKDFTTKIKGYLFNVSQMILNTCVYLFSIYGTQLHTDKLWK